jgi:type VI secretion system (T6SS) phospholipase Tle1-like effector
MAKNIILLSDGTGNAASKVWRTNVWRLFEAIDLSGPDQVAFYADGVGTSSFKPLALFGGMFGWGLKRNVIECYKFVCRTYQPGDRIYGFGFSRGAYTIRVVAKFILLQGLVRYDNSEADLERYAEAAYRDFRRKTCRDSLVHQTVAPPSRRHFSNSLRRASAKEGNSLSWALGYSCGLRVACRRVDALLQQMGISVRDFGCDPPSWHRARMSCVINRRRKNHISSGSLGRTSNQ